MTLNSSTPTAPSGDPSDQTVGLSHGQAVIRFVLVYAFLHILFSSMDIWTTWVGKDMSHLVESNPYTDLASIYTLSMPEVIHLFVGSLIVGLCAYARRQRIVEIASYNYRSFLEHIWVFHLEALALALVTMAFSRFIVIINNLLCMWLHFCVISGEYIIGNLNLSSTLLFFCGVMISFLPASYFMYRVLRI